VAAFDWLAEPKPDKPAPRFSLRMGEGWWHFQFAIGPLGIHLPSALRAAKEHYSTVRIQPTSTALAGQWTP
jgi:hypothetical protein